MKKIFKSKKKHQIKLNGIYKFLLISFLIAFFLSRLKIFNNKNFINVLKDTSTNKINISNIDFKGEYLLNIGLTNFNNIKFTKEVFKSVEKKKKVLDERIYIYNTHQTEEYSTIENYNLTPTVLTASFILQDKLNDYNIGSIVEESSLKDGLEKNGYTYSEAYLVSKEWLKNIDAKMDLYIDLHRDSLDYKYSNILIDNKDYAKIMFVVGTNHENYEKNLKVAQGIDNEIKKINSKISRGILEKPYVYNQNFNSNCILIELGAEHSTYESISNSIEILAKAIKNYLG